MVLLNDEMGEPQAVEVLCHEWAHALPWNFAVDRLINAHDAAAGGIHSATAGGGSIRSIGFKAR